MQQGLIVVVGLILVAVLGYANVKNHQAMKKDCQEQGGYLDSKYNWAYEETEYFCVVNGQRFWYD